MSEVVVFSAHARDRAGKGAARAARRDGLLPCVIYGDKKEPLMVSVDPKPLIRELHKHGFFSRQFDISLNGENHRVLARDVQFHPLKDTPIHADFLRVTPNTKVHVNIPVHFLNDEESPGLKQGGVLNVVRHEIEVICAVSKMPEIFEIDLTGAFGLTRRWSRPRARCHNRSPM